MQFYIRSQNCFILDCWNIEEIMSVSSVSLKCGNCTSTAAKRINWIFVYYLGEIWWGAKGLSQTDWTSFVRCCENEIQEVAATTVPSSCRRSTTVHWDTTDCCSAARSSAAATTVSTSSTSAAETSGAWSGSIVSRWQQWHATVSASATAAAAATVAGNWGRPIVQWHVRWSHTCFSLFFDFGPLWWYQYFVNCCIALPFGLITCLRLNLYTVCYLQAL